MTAIEQAIAALEQSHEFWSAYSSLNEIGQSRMEDEAAEVLAATAAALAALRSLQPQAEPPASMRAEFEAWVQDRGCDTDGAWSAWQGCWNLRNCSPQAEPVAWRVRGYSQFKTGNPGQWRYFDGAKRPDVNNPDCCDFEPLFSHPPSREWRPISEAPSYSVALWDAIAELVLACGGSTADFPEEITAKISAIVDALAARPQDKTEKTI